MWQKSPFYINLTEIFTLYSFPFFCHLSLVPLTPSGHLRDIYILKMDNNLSFALLAPFAGLAAVVMSSYLISNVMPDPCLKMHMTKTIYTYIHMCVCVYIYIYIFGRRETKYESLYSRIFWKRRSYYIRRQILLMIFHAIY